MRQANIILIGVGGVGGWCAEALVRTGCTQLTLVDDDAVAPSNINRQPAALTSTIGRAKAEVLRMRLLDINPTAHIRALVKRYTPETADQFNLGDYTFVIDAIDCVPCKGHLIKTALALRDKGVTLFSSMGAAGRLDPGQICVTRFDKVTGDGLARALRQYFKRTAQNQDTENAQERMAKAPLHFTCVWSKETPKRDALCEDGGRGSIMSITATFGLRLASLVLEALSTPCTRCLT